MNKIEIQQSTGLTAEQVWKCLRNAVERFNKSSDQRTLLCAKDKGAQPTKVRWPAANEPAISHRLAFYLECELRAVDQVTDLGSIAVDCEYDRHLRDRKKLEAEPKYRKFVEKYRAVSKRLNARGNFEFLILPDIIVHERLTNSNYLVVELKKRTRAKANAWEEEYDHLKLAIFTRTRPTGYGYEIGAWVVAEDMLMADKRCLWIAKRYQNGEGKVLTA